MVWRICVRGVPVRYAAGRSCLSRAGLQCCRTGSNLKVVSDLVRAAFHRHGAPTSCRPWSDRRDGHVAVPFIPSYYIIDSQCRTVRRCSGGGKTDSEASPSQPTTGDSVKLGASLQSVLLSFYSRCRDSTARPPWGAKSSGSRKDRLTGASAMSKSSSRYAIAMYWTHRCGSPDIITDGASFVEVVGASVVSAPGNRRNKGLQQSGEKYDIAVSRDCTIVLA
jgi:hypothetical protein